MQYNLRQLKYQASQCKESLKLETKHTLGYIVHGTKLLYDKPTDTIIILNLTRSGDFFAEMREDEYKIFYQNGWKAGVLMMALKNYNRKLMVIETKIKAETNSRKNEKHVRKLKDSRRRFLNLYAETKRKLNNFINLKTKKDGNSKQKKLLY